MADSLVRFKYHMKQAKRIMKFQKWINRSLDKWFYKHSEICKRISVEWEKEV